MADILIRGMEMPTDRDVTIRIDPNGEVYVYDTYPTLLLRAVPLPEGHGRLGDLDALKENLRTVEFWNGSEQVVSEQDIDDAQTIVPAE